MCGSVFDICILEFQRLTLSASHISQNHAPALYWSVRKEFFAKKSTERVKLTIDLTFALSKEVKKLISHNPKIKNYVSIWACSWTYHIGLICIWIANYSQISVPSKFDVHVTSVTSISDLFHKQRSWPYICITEIFLFATIIPC